MEAFIGRYVSGALVPFAVFGAGIYFLFYLRFFFVRSPIKTFSLLFRKNSGGDSGFSALTVALAGTLGVGNIIGVASALIMGGPGSVFWMVFSAFAAMVLKYCEIVLAHRHRRFENGEIRGGAMYYMEDFFGKCGKRLGSAVGGIFAVFCLINAFSMGSMLQARAVSGSVTEISEIPSWAVAAVLTLICGIVVFKGIHDISPLTGVIIPIMSLVYAAMSIAVIFCFRSDIGETVAIIFRDAFSFRSAAGGSFAFLLSSSLRYGCMRGILSNEAGCGTAPIAHAASKNKSAFIQGIWGIMEVFVDTVLLCTLTGLSVLLAVGDDLSNFGNGEEMKLVLTAYGSAIGGLAAPLMTVMVSCFAFATIICWAYYGNSTLKYISENKAVGALFKVIYLICIFFGAASVDGGELCWLLSDTAICGMAILNLSMLFLSRREIKEETEMYLKERR